MSTGQARLQLILEMKNRLQGAMGDARKYVNTNVSALKAKLNELSTANSNAMSAIAGEIPGVSSSLGMLANPYAAGAAAAVAAGAAYVKATQLSNEWKTSMAQVNVTAQLTKEELGGLSDELRTIGKRSEGADIMEVPEAFNKIVSAGLDVNTSLDALEPTLKAAKAGFTDVKTTAEAAVSTMTSSGIMDATRVYDILFATLNKGNAEFGDIAAYLPKIIPGAKQAGFSLEQVGGAFAYMTAQGFKAEAAATGLQNVFKAFSTPDIIYGSKSKGGFKSLGVEIFDASGKMRSMVDIVEALSVKMDGLTDEQRVNKFASIGLDMEAAGALASMTQNVQSLKETIDFTTNSQGQLNQAVENSKTPLDSWKRISNEVKGVMLDIGDSGSEAFGMIGEKILEAIQWVKDFYNNNELVRDIVWLIGESFKFAFNLAVSAVTRVWNVLKFLWGIINDVKVAIFGAGDGFEQWYYGVKPYLTWVYEMFGKISDLMYKVATFDFSGAFDAVKNFELPDIDEIRSRQTAERFARNVANQNKEAMEIIAPPGAQLVPPGGTASPGATGPAAPSNADNGNMSKVTGSAEQNKNITINIDTLGIKGGFTSQNSEVSKMDKRQLEQWFNEMLLRAIHNVETSYS